MMEKGLMELNLEDFEKMDNRELMELFRRYREEEKRLYERLQNPGEEDKLAVMKEHFEVMFRALVVGLVFKIRTEGRDAARGDIEYVRRLYDYELNAIRRSEKILGGDGNWKPTVKIPE